MSSDAAQLILESSSVTQPDVPLAAKPIDSKSESGQLPGQRRRSKHEVCAKELPGAKSFLPCQASGTLSDPLHALGPCDPKGNRLMFLNLLDAHQQRLFVSAARTVAEKDGKVADVEESLLEAVRAECEIDEEPEVIPPDELLARLDDALAGNLHARNAFMLELAGVAVIDGDAHPAELGVLHEIGGHLAIPEDVLAEFVQFAMSARELVVRGRHLLSVDHGS